MKDNKLSRRNFFPLLTGAFLIPFSKGEKNILENTSENLADEEFEILLNKKGEAVKVRKSALKTAKKTESQVSNSWLKKWLNK